MPLIRLLLLFFAVGASGCALVTAFTGAPWRSPEGLGLGLATGVAVGAGSQFLLSALGLPLGFIPLMVSFAILSAAGLAVTRFRPPRAETDVEPTRWWSGRVETRSVLLLLLVALLLWRMLVGTLSLPFSSWDEFSYWGLATKGVFTERSLDLSRVILDQSRHYPLLVPVSGATIAFALGRFAENYAKLASTLCIIPVLLLLYGMARRLGFAVVEALLFLILFMASGSQLGFMATILLSNVPFMALFSAGVTAYVLAPLTPRPRGALALAGLLLGMAAWSRAEGVQIVAVTVATLVAVDFLSGMRPRLEAVAAMAAAAVGPSLGWRAYLAAHWPTWMQWDVGNVREASLVERAVAATPEMLRRVTSLGLWSGVWVLTAAAAIASLVLSPRKRAPRLLLAVVVLHTLAYWASYMLVFPSDEALTAASFERYTAHVLPLAVLLIMFVYAIARDRLHGAGLRDWAAMERPERPGSKGIAVDDLGPVKVPSGEDAAAAGR